jgi:ADP-ribose pyrophosphatase YjhB (NUDIX family)
VRCSAGHQHWGRNGAAGLLLRAPDARGRTSVLLQKRAWWTHHGTTWGLPGGARASWETAEQTAMRETGEEVVVRLDAVEVTGIHDDDHGGWCYTTVIAAMPDAVDASPRGRETADVRWVPIAEVTDLDLHPGFAATWPVLGGTG